MVDPLNAGVSAIRGVGDRVGRVADDVGEAVDRRVPEPEEIRDATVEVVEDAGIRAPDDANFIASQEEAVEQIRESPQTTRRQAIENLQERAGGEDADPAAVDATAGLQDELDQRARQLNEAVEQPARAGPVPNIAEGAVESLNPFAAASGVVEASERATTAALGQDREAQAQIGAEVLQAPEAAEEAVENIQQNPAEAAGRAAGLTVAALGGGVAASRGARAASNIDADIPGVAKSAATEVADRAGPVVSRELEAAGIDTSNFQPLTTQRQQVGAVFGQPQQARSRFRELDRPAPGETGGDIDRPVRTFAPGEQIDVDPPRRIETGEDSEFLQRTNEPDVQTTLRAFEAGDFDAPDVETLRAQGQEPITASLIRRGEGVERGEAAAQQVEGEAFLEAPTRGFVEERTPDFEAEGAGLAERAEVGTRAQVGTVDFGDGEQVVVEGARGQTGLPEVALEVVEPGIARRVLGERSRIEIRGEPSNQPTEAALDEVLGDVQERFDETMETRRVGRAEAQLLGGGQRQRNPPTPEEAGREAIEQQDPAFIDPDDPAALSVGEEVADDFGTFDFSPNPFTGLGGGEEAAEVDSEVPTDVDTGVLPTGETVESPLDETDVGQTEFLAPTDETDTAQDTQPRQDDRLLPAQDQEPTPTVITPNPTQTDEGGTRRTPTPEFPLPDAEETEDEEEGGALGDLFTENPVASASEVLDDDGGIL